MFLMVLMLIMLSVGDAQVRGVWLSGWQELGYWYATPEAWEVGGNYRSLGYMRPLSVWAMHWALKPRSTS